MNFDWQKVGQIQHVEVESGSAQVFRGHGTMKVEDWLDGRTKTCPVWECVVYDSGDNIIRRGQWPSMKESKIRAECSLIASL